LTDPRYVTSLRH